MAALSGASEVCRALETFADVQDDAWMWQVGRLRDFSHSNAAVPMVDGLIRILDLDAQAGSDAYAAASVLLRETILGTNLVPEPFKKIPDDAVQVRCWVDRACRGLRVAEDLLLKGPGELGNGDSGIATQCFLKTVELRGTWQGLRMAAVKTACCGKPLDDFWQTHLTAEAMVSALTRSCGDVFQLLLVALWLYTREAWFRHILDACFGLPRIGCSRRLAGVVPVDACSGSSSDVAEGTTGATPLRPVLPPNRGVAVVEVQQTPRLPGPTGPLLEALAPSAQLVQTALAYFDERGVRHTQVVYRPLVIPAQRLRRLTAQFAATSSAVCRKSSLHAVDCNVAGDSHGAVRYGAKQEEARLAAETGPWLVLGAGGFLSAMSSRTEAVRRLVQTRCNVLLAIRPADDGPCFAKHLALKGNSVDDVLFPAGVLFRVTRIKQTFNCDLDPLITGCQEEARWQVTVIELASSDRFLEAAALLERRGALTPLELDSALHDWGAAAAAEERPQRWLAAGKLIVGGDRPQAAASLLERAALLAEELGDGLCVARAQIMHARCMLSTCSCLEGGADSCAAPFVLRGKIQKALDLLIACLGEDHAEVQEAHQVMTKLQAFT